MKAKPYQSPLEKHYKFIRDERRKRTSWKDIADLLNQKDANVGISANGIIQWFKRRQKRTSLPLGFEEAPSTSTQEPVKNSTIKSQERVSKLLNTPDHSSISTPKNSKWDFGDNTTLTKKVKDNT